MLGGFPLASWRTLGWSWDIGGHNQGHFEIQAWFLLIFDAFRDAILRGFWVPWTKTYVFSYASFQASCSNGSWVWIWMSRIGKLTILQGRYCKNQLSQKLRFSWFQGPFSWFWLSMGPIFMTFVALATGLKFDDFSKWLWGHPRSKVPAWLVGTGSDAGVVIKMLRGAGGSLTWK